MFHYSPNELETLGAEITVNEIVQQPELWQEAYDNYLNQKETLDAFLKDIQDKHDKVQVLFTGAGTSAYVGETISPYLSRVGHPKWDFKNAPTTDIVSDPHHYLRSDKPTLLISFARSGNSPESVATVELADQIVDEIYHLTITCAPDGKLAVNAKDKANNVVLLQPERSNDKGFAMTGSFTCMVLSALLIFDPETSETKRHYVTQAREMVASLTDKKEAIQAFVAQDFKRIIYLGSGALAGIAREAQLKILELTAGKVATQFESSLGFRHGPKSFVDETTALVTFLSNDAYTRQYDVDIVHEVSGDAIALDVFAIHVGEEEGVTGVTFDDTYRHLPDAYLALPYIYIGQMIGVETAIKLNNTPDTPSPTGTVNRVVKGVTIHPLDDGQ